MADEIPSDCLKPFVGCAPDIAAVLDGHVLGDLGGIRGDRLRQLAALGRMAGSLRPAPGGGCVELHPVLGRFGEWLAEDAPGTLRVLLHPFGFLVARGTPPTGLDLLGVEMFNDNVPLLDATSRTTMCIRDVDALEVDVLVGMATAMDRSAIRSTKDVAECLQMLGEIHAAFALVGTIMQGGPRPRRLPPMVSVVFEEVRRYVHGSASLRPISISGAGVVVTFELSADCQDTPFRVVSITRKPS